MKCPKGYICLADRWGMPFFVGVLITLVLIGVIYIFQKQRSLDDMIPQLLSQTKSQSLSVEERQVHPPLPTNVTVDVRGPIGIKPEYGDDIGNNPYIPPLKPHQHGLPINIRTRGGMRNFAQLGVLTGTKEGKQVVLPLYGRPTYGGSDYYEYYTASDGFQSFKMPILNHGKDCTNERGCKELFDKDIAQVKGYSENFRVDLYENETPRYIPHL